MPMPIPAGRTEDSSCLFLYVIIMEVVMRSHLSSLAAVLAVLFLAGSAAAQDMKSETSGEIPALSAFHEIIYPIWHTAYPSKDYAALRGFVSQVDSLAANIYAIKLPAILHEKTAKWNAALAQFKAAVIAYDKAAATKDDAALLNAAEALHAKYEGLVRAIRPVLAEMDVFHQALYVVYHKYASAKQYDEIRGASADLLAKAEAVAQAHLPKSREAKSEAFKKAAAELVDAAKSLDAAGRNHDHDGMDKGVERLHAKFQALEKLFE
jgi:hypothetical protein